MLSEQPGNVRPFTYFAILKYLCALARVQVREPRLWEVRAEAWAPYQPPHSPDVHVVLRAAAQVQESSLRVLLLGSHMGFSPVQKCPPSHPRPGSALLQEGLLGACWFPSWLAFGRKRAKPRHTPKWTLQSQCNLSCSVSLLGGSCPLQCAVREVRLSRKARWLVQGPCGLTLDCPSLQYSSWPREATLCGSWWMWWLSDSGVFSKPHKVLCKKILQWRHLLTSDIGVAFAPDLISIFSRMGMLVKKAISSVSRWICPCIGCSPSY